MLPCVCWGVDAGLKGPGAALAVKERHGATAGVIGSSQVRFRALPVRHGARAKSLAFSHGCRALRLRRHAAHDGAEQGKAGLR